MEINHHSIFKVQFSRPRLLLFLFKHRLTLTKQVYYQSLSSRDHPVFLWCEGNPGPYCLTLSFFNERNDFFKNRDLVFISRIFLRSCRDSLVVWRNALCWEKVHAVKECDGMQYRTALHNQLLTELINVGIVWQQRAIIIPSVLSTSEYW